MTFHSRTRRSFTLVELLVVMGIIAILSAITLSALAGVNQRAGATRAQNEIVAMNSAIERYKEDNGVSPVVTTAMTTNATTGYPVTPSSYTNNAASLYAALAGKANYVATTLTGPVYMHFNVSQLTTNAIGTPDYVTDPFGNAYGYQPSPNAVYNTTSYDLWSTGGQSGIAGQTNTARWISNWKNN